MEKENLIRRWKERHGRKKADKKKPTQSDLETAKETIGTRRGIGASASSKRSETGITQTELGKVIDDGSLPISPQTGEQTARQTAEDQA